MKPGDIFRFNDGYVFITVEKRSEYPYVCWAVLVIKERGETSHNISVHTEYWIKRLCNQIA